MSTTALFDYTRDKVRLATAHHTSLTTLCMQQALGSAWCAPGQAVLTMWGRLGH